MVKSARGTLFCPGRAVDEGTAVAASVMRSAVLTVRNAGFRTT